MFRKIITYLTIYSFMFSNVCWAAMITPDGRTQTTVNVNGHVYDVTTSTVSGKTRSTRFPISTSTREPRSTFICPVPRSI